MRAVRIGITLDHEASPPRAMLRDKYYDAVRAVGGVPLLLPPVEDARYLDEALDAVDGLLVGGGDDLHPSLWGEAEVHAACTLVTPRRQRFDVAIVARALARGVPFLGICCGMQTLNVALGGSVIQDLPSAMPGAIAHKAPPGGAIAMHEVTLAAASRLRAALGERAAVEVNSLHHQACGRLGAGLRAVAPAPDGVIEAIELAASGAFALGVQWHPEKLANEPPHRAVIALLVEMAASLRPRTGVAPEAPASFDRPHARPAARTS